MYYRPCIVLGLVKTVEITLYINVKFVSKVFYHYIVKVLLALAIKNIKVEILSVAVNVAITHSCTYTTKPYMNSQA